MQEASTQHASTSPLDDGQRDLRRRRRRTGAAGLVAAAALVAWLIGQGLDREESIEPAQAPTPAEEVAYGFLDAYAAADNPSSGLLPGEGRRPHRRLVAPRPGVA
jgi:hypothetical protein